MSGIKKMLRMLFPPVREPIPSNASRAEAARDFFETSARVVDEAEKLRKDLQSDDRLGSFVRSARRDGRSI